MATWSTRGLRGSTLEELINFSIEKYRERHLALIQKIPTPIKPIQIEKESRHITLAYFDQKSTVDYIGVVQGIPVCFDAKECAADTFPLANIHAHQMSFMKEFEQQKGIAFLLLFFRIFPIGTPSTSGTGRKRVAARALPMRRLTAPIVYPAPPDSRFIF